MKVTTLISLIKLLGKISANFSLRLAGRAGDPNKEHGRDVLRELVPAAEVATTRLQLQTNFSAISVLYLRA